MLYRKVIAVWSEIHTKHVKTLCGQNVEFWNCLKDKIRPLTGGPVACCLAQYKRQANQPWD
jgi:hypothetical protein